MKYLAAICFALIPFGFWGQNIFFGQANTLLLSAMFILFLCEQDNNYKLNGWIKIFGVYLSCWMSFTFLMIFLGRWPQALSMTMIESVFFVFAGMTFFLAVYRGSLSLNAWSNIICIVATIQAILGILQTQGLDPIVPFLSLFVGVIGQMDFTTPTGTLGNQNFLAAFLAISLPFFFRIKWHNIIIIPIEYDTVCPWKDHEIKLPYGWFLALPIIIYALILTRTTTAIGAAIVGSVYYFFGRKWALASVIPAFILYAVKYKGFILSNARTEYWLDAWKSTSHSWQTLIFGWGPGITWHPGNMLHSEYVNTFFSFGLIGIALMMGYIFHVYKMNKMLFTVFIILCIDMLGNHALHITPTAVLIIIIIALIEREKKDLKCQ